MRRIDAPRAWGSESGIGRGGRLAPDASARWRWPYADDRVRVRIVRESDWRKLMALRKAVRPLVELPIGECMACGTSDYALCCAWDALEKGGKGHD